MFLLLEYRTTGYMAGISPSCLNSLLCCRVSVNFGEDPFLFDIKVTDDIKYPPLFF